MRGTPDPGRSRSRVRGAASELCVPACVCTYVCVCVSVCLPPRCTIEQGESCDRLHHLPSPSFLFSSLSVNPHPPPHTHTHTHAHHDQLGGAARGREKGAMRRGAGAAGSGRARRPSQCRGLFPAHCRLDEERYWCVYMCKCVCVCVHGLPPVKSRTGLKREPSGCFTVLFSLSFLLCTPHLSSALPTALSYPLHTHAYVSPPPSSARLRHLLRC